MARKDKPVTDKTKVRWRRKPLFLTKEQQLKGLQTKLKRIKIRHVETPDITSEVIGANKRSLFRLAWTMYMDQGCGNGLNAFTRYRGELYDPKAAAKRARERAEKQREEKVTKDGNNTTI